MSDHFPKLQRFSSLEVHRALILVFVAIALWYLSWWFDWSRAGSIILFGLLFVGELYHVWQSLGYMHTIWREEEVLPRRSKTSPPVDVFITVCGEPVEIVAATAKAAKNMIYPNFKVYILNDGYVANKANWQEIEDLVT